MSAGNVKRDRILSEKALLKEQGKTVDEGSIAENLPEQEVCVCVFLFRYLARAYLGGGAKGWNLPLTPLSTILDTPLVGVI